MRFIAVTSPASLSDSPESDTVYLIVDTEPSTGGPTAIARAAGEGSISTLVSALNYAYPSGD